MESESLGLCLYSVNQLCDPEQVTYFLQAPVFLKCKAAPPPHKVVWLKLDSKWESIWNS